MVARDEWVVVQLSQRGEDEDPDLLRDAIRRTLRDAEVFIPASISKVGETRVVHRLVDGYAFIRRTLPDPMYFRLEGTKYVEHILTAMAHEGGRRVRKISPIPARDVDKMRKQIHVETEQGIELGDEVQVTSGVYRGITGRIIEEIPENESVQVHIKLRSKEAIVTLPRSFLKFSSKGQGELPSFSPFETKIARIRGWVRQAQPIFSWKPQPLSVLTESLKTVQRLAGWETRRHQLTQFQWAGSWEADLSPIYKLRDTVVALDQWAKAANRLWPHYKLSKSQPGAISVVESKFLEAQWLHDAVRRLASIHLGVEDIERTLSSRSPDMIQNIIIDGHNLAYRVFHAFNAPTSKPMSDAQGRPTSVVYGVMKGIGALQKRFPEAQIYVCWDGSPVRRKTMYPEYKANRPTRQVGGDGFNQIEYLRELLPKVGVIQAFNPEEETDDIIACLVKGKLQGQNNIIVSTDHDFIQLVTRTDVLMVPKVSNRPETLYDPDLVVAEYGVEPSKVVQLRALMGSADASDNLKGVPRVPTKVLASLVNAHGSVDGIYASGMAGLTKNQYEKIRAAEKQVKLNVQLMTLKSDLPYTLFASSPDSEEATRLLSEVGIQAEPVLKAFFRQMKGFEKHS